MGFKMKGSAFKLNDVATKSALKSKGEWRRGENKEASGSSKTTWGHGTPETGYVEYDNEGRVKHMKAEHRRGEIENSENPPTQMKSPLEQGYEGTKSIKHKEATKENISAHKENVKKTLATPKLTADEVNAELAKTRHLEGEKKVKTKSDPKKKYPKNPKGDKKKKGKRKLAIKVPKIKINLKGGGRGGYEMGPGGRGGWRG